MRRYILHLCLTLLFFFLDTVIFAQCPDFTDLSSSIVTCYYGSTSDPFQYTGIASGRHTVITQQGSDPYTGHQMPFLPAGENRVVKLGNRQIGAEAEAITYTFTVDPDFAILLLKFALVLQDPNHAEHHQPRFVVRVLNFAGELVESCAQYDVRVAEGIEGFETFHDAASSYGWIGYVRYRPWTNVGIDLSNYIGQQVQVQFITYDCALGAHFGYAYFTAKCMSNKIELEDCENGMVTLSAPDGFESYQWNNGSTLPTATYQVQQNATVANCLITSATGCQFTLSGTISPIANSPTQNATFYDTVCEGESYVGNGFLLEPEYATTGTNVFRNTYFDAGSCQGGDVTNTLFLTVIPEYEHIYDMACEGQDYYKHGFNLHNLQPGVINDTLVSAVGNCIHSTILHLTVDNNFTLPAAIQGSTSLCDNTAATFSLPNANVNALYEWILPDGVEVLLGDHTPTLNCYITSQAANPAQVILKATNGCGTGIIPITVFHNPTYTLFIQDTICSGNSYNGSGFSLPIIDSTGIYTFVEKYSSSQGCDSTHILQLSVGNTPSLEIVAQPEEICEGQSVDLHAIGGSAEAYLAEPPAVAIGDVLCTDGSIVKINKWPEAGKTAMGIVFFVDNTGQHGWAVDIRKTDGTYKWQDYIGDDFDVPNLTNYTSVPNALKDTNGLYNTQILTSTGSNPSQCWPAAHAVDYANGWYLPAMGQLSILMSISNIVNNSLMIVGGNSIQTEDYWSSTEGGGNAYQWMNFSEGMITEWDKSSFSHVRAVRSF